MDPGFLINTSKNQKCPCGSGKKFKRCCIGKSVDSEINLEITTDPISVSESKITNPLDEQEFMQLSSDLVYGKVKDFVSTLSKLKKMKQKYPEHKRIYNLIGICYQALNEFASLEENILETYRRFPNYLFAKTGFVSYWMSKNDYSKFEEAFGNKYDLKSLYPNRRKFHISEAVAFFTVCGRYFANKGQISIAKKYRNMVYELKPHSPDVSILDKEILLAGLSKNLKQMRI